MWLSTDVLACIDRKSKTVCQMIQFSNFHFSLILIIESHILKEINTLHLGNEEINRSFLNISI